MNSSSLAELDLAQAWRRMKLDRPQRVFYSHPRLIEWIELDLDGWFDLIRQRLARGYVPSTPLNCAVPKPGWLVRPGAVLDEQDELVFNALVGGLCEQALSLIGTFQGDPDVAYQLNPSLMAPNWILKGFAVWAEFSERSLQKLKGAQFVVFADIAGFYENIDLHRLSSDLRPLMANPELLEQLMSLLNKWASPRAKGIPQAFSASDILAKIYLNPIDRALKNENFSHLRYVDDIRIFCRSRLEAKSALLLLNELMAKRGLNLQSAKTRILRADEASREIDGINPMIQAIQSDLAAQIYRELPEPSAISLDEIEDYFNSHSSSLEPDVLERAFVDNFTGGNERFNKTLLHYLLTRLGKVKSNVAVKYSIELLQQRPEETGSALRYLAQLDLNEQDKDAVVDFVSSPEAIYDYQNYQVIAWLIQASFFPDSLVRLCRKWAFDRNKKLWLRVVARAVLGIAGDQSDLEAIEGSYDSRIGELECADIADALSRMENGRRNSFYGRISGDSALVGRAVKRVRLMKNTTPTP